jgi:DNA-binding XRE family transcriptional regulator
METPKTEQGQRTEKNGREFGTEESAPAKSTSSAKDENAEKRSLAASGPVVSSIKAKPKRKNNVRKLRMERMMSKAELARRAGLSTLTIDRVEKGMACRMDTKRKILEALGLTPTDRVTVFGDDD